MNSRVDLDWFDPSTRENSEFSLSQEAENVDMFLYKSIKLSCNRSPFTDANAASAASPPSGVPSASAPADALILTPSTEKPVKQDVVKGSGSLQPSAACQRKTNGEILTGCRDESSRRSESPSTWMKDPDETRGPEPSLKLRLWRGVFCPLYVLAKHNGAMLADL